MSPRLVVGITGATGAVYGVRLLERARALHATALAVADDVGQHCFSPAGLTASVAGA